MSGTDYDLVVIGAGSGGVRAARIAAQHGARVAIVEEYRVGGTCVIRGCVPKKLLVYASHFSEAFEDAAGYGWTAGPARFDWAKLIANKDREIARLEAIYRRNLEAAGVTIIEDRATLAGPNAVALTRAGRTLSAGTILIAVGAAPWLPGDLPGHEHVITSNEAFHLPALPKRVIVAGGGYIAVEFAGIFRGLGAEVDLVYRGPMILRGFDDDVRAHMTAEMQKKGIRFHLNTIFERIERDGDTRRACLTTGETLEADCVMMAVGRTPSTARLGLEEHGVKLGHHGSVEVDAFGRTSVPTVYAVGDVTDRLNLTPVAIREGHAFADTVFGGRPTRVDHADVPTAVFGQPEIGTVGLTEAEAHARFGHVDIYRTRFRPMLHTLSGRDEQMLMKLIVEPESDRVVGVHVIGPAAAEMIQCVGIAVKMGATKAQFDATMALHPSAAEELVTMRTKLAQPAAA